MTRTTTPRPGFALLPLLYALFLLSGATGLVYEVAWTRIFVFVFGNTTYAVSAVLSAFMAGLALGSLLAGRRVDARSPGEALRLYALLELGIGLAALAVPSALDLLDAFYALAYRELAFSPVALSTTRVALSFAVLLVPTSLMGATLPAMSRFAVEEAGQIPLRVGLLYGLNTLGAALGCFATGFFLLEYLGVRGSAQLAAAVNGALALAFWLLSRALSSRLPERPPAPAADAQRVSTRVAALVLLAAALTGFTSLGYEVLWTRLLVFKLKTTTYAFAIMLTTFLAGIGLGSGLLAAVRRLFAPRHYTGLFAGLQAATGLCGLGSILVFGRLEALFATGLPRLAEQMLAAAAVMFVPTLLMGASFPVLVHLCARRLGGVGVAVGATYSANTLGAVLGAACAGFALVGLLGTQNALALMALLNLLNAALLPALAPEPSEGRMRQLAPALLPAALALAAFAAIPRDLLFQYYNAGERELDSQVEIVHAEEGVEGITTVHRLPNGDRVISTGSINVAGTSTVLRSTQKLQAHIPLLLHPRPENILQIGFGSGETAHIVTTYPIERLDVAEISHSVLVAADRYFGDLNRGVIAHPRFAAAVMDGTNYLRLTERRYDVIMNDSIWPFYAGNSGLYTREHFLAGSQRLRPGGLMTSWLPLDMHPENFKTILATFHSVFPYFSVWISPTHYTKHALLVGSAEPLRLDVVLFLSRFAERAREDLQGIDLGDPALLLNCFVADEGSLSSFLADVPIHTTDHPILEFASSEATYRSQLAVYELLVGQRRPILAHLHNWEGLEDRSEVFAGQVQQTYQATGHVLRAFLLREARSSEQEREFARAAALRPDHPGVRTSAQYALYLRELELEAIEGRNYAELMGLADRLAKSGQYEKAARVLQEAVRLDSLRPQAHREWALVLGQAERLDEAVQRFARALELDPDDAATHLNLGNALRRQSKIEAAEASYRRALELDPNLVEAHYSLGTLLQERGLGEAAIAALRQALRLRPDYVRAHVNLGILLDGQGHLQEAATHFRQAVRLAPGDPTARNNLVIALVRSGHLEEARAGLEEALRQQIDLPHARRTLVAALAARARSHAQEGDRERAAALLGQAAELTPPSLRAPLLEELRGYEEKR